MKISRFSETVKKKILEIAKQYIVSVEFRGHLEELHDDSDYLEIPVWDLEAALLAAYEYGTERRIENESY